MKRVIIIKNKENLTVILFSIFTALIPILEYYNSPIKTLNMTTFLALVFLFVFILKSKITKTFHSVYILLTFIILFSIFSYSFNNVVINFINIFPILRLILYVTTFFIFGFTYFNARIFYKTLRLAVILSTIIIVLQIISFYIFDFKIPSTFLFLYRDINFYTNTSTIYRPSGLYMEPSHFAISATFLITILLLNRANTIKNKRLIIIISSLGILFSTSGMGYLFMIVLFLTYFITTIKNFKRSNFSLLLLLFLLFPIILITMWNIEFFKISILRLVDLNNIIEGLAINGRIGSRELFFNLPDNQKFIGIGYGQSNTSLYFSSLFIYLYELGYLSLFVIILFLYYTFRRENIGLKRYLLINYLIMIIFSSVLSISYLAFMLLFLKKIKLQTTI